MINVFLGLPDEFAPPGRAAEHIVKVLKTRVEREAYWLRIPEGWRVHIGYIAALMFGHELCAVEGLAARRAALEEVPPILRAEVEWRLRALWNTKELRAMNDAEFAAAYPQCGFRREAA